MACLTAFMFSSTASSSSTAPFGACLEIDNERFPLFLTCQANFKLPGLRFDHNDFGLQGPSFGDVLGCFDRLAPFTIRSLSSFLCLCASYCSDWSIHSTLSPRPPLLCQDVIGLRWSANTCPASFPSDMTYENDELRHDLFNASLIF